MALIVGAYTHDSGMECQIGLFQRVLSALEVSGHSAYALRPKG